MRTDRQAVSSSRQADPDAKSIVKRFDAPEKLLVFDQGRLELITMGGRVFGKGSYAPGWRWSQVATAPLRSREGPPEHVGVVLSGHAKVVIDEGREIEITAGDLFHVSTEYDSWVVGYRPCEVLYLSGIEALVNRVSRPAAP